MSDKKNTEIAVNEGFAALANRDVLNEAMADDCQGLEFSFDRVKLPAGDMIVYPSSNLHQVTPVTRGARIASFFWVQSLVRDDTRRRMLLEMDTALTRLRTSGAEAAAVLQLTGVYHNLLRQWAET